MSDNSQMILPESDSEEEDSEEESLPELLLSLEELESLESLELSDSVSAGFTTAGLGIVFRWARNSSLQQEGRQGILINVYLSEQQHKD